MYDKNSFGKNLQRIRKSKGLTQAKLAELAEINEKHISKLELGIYKPNYETLNKVLSALDIDIKNLKFEEYTTQNDRNQFYIKSLQILNNADNKELEIYYGLLKQGQLGINLNKAQ